MNPRNSPRRCSSDQKIDGGGSSEESRGSTLIETSSKVGTERTSMAFLLHSSFTTEGVVRPFCQPNSTNIASFNKGRSEESNQTWLIPCGRLRIEPCSKSEQEKWLHMLWPRRHELSLGQSLHLREAMPPTRRCLLRRLRHLLLENHSRKRSRLKPSQSLRLLR